VSEQTFYQPRGGRIRPFLLAAGVSHRHCSLPLQRVLVDFGAEHAFNQVHHHMKEHYGIELPRRVTLYHASCIALLEEKHRGQRSGKPKACIISETDGSMVPIVNIDAEQPDKRKKKALCYREARLTLAREKGSVSPVFSAMLKEVSTAGEHMADCVQRVGLGSAWCR
jgi:hypothetical protein